MDIEEIKKIMNKSTAILIMDNGNPSFVVLGYDMYKDIVLNKKDEKEVKVNNGKAEEKIETGDGKTEDTEPIDKLSGSEDKPDERESEILERINKDIQALKGEIEEEEKKLGID